MANDIHRERPYLMLFKGTIINSFQPFYQHRWLAAEYYLWKEPDFRIDVRCKKMSMIPGRDKRVVKPYEVEPSPEDYCSIKHLGFVWVDPVSHRINLQNICRQVQFQ